MRCVVIACFPWEWHRWVSEDAQLVAIETLWHKHPTNLLRCARMRVVFETIRICFPNLCRALDILPVRTRWESEPDE